MKSGEQLLKKIQDGCLIAYCVVFGEPFYVQLFLNYDLLGCQYIVYTGDGLNPNDFWIQQGKLSSTDKLEKMPGGLIVYCGLDKNLRSDFVRKNASLSEEVYDVFDIDEVRNTGGFHCLGKTYIVDDVKWVASNPDYMRQAYNQIEEKNLFAYLQELVKEPAGRFTSKKGIISLNEYHSKFINHINGQRVTLTPRGEEFSIHIFGDSRVSGYMLEDKDLFHNILQDKINKEGKSIKIINYGIPGREIDRIWKQVTTAPISKNDIVFVMTACHEYRNLSYEHQDAFAMYCKRINDVCKKRRASFVYINLPTTVEIISPNRFEENITDLYRNYKFIEYSFDLVSKYKIYLFKKLNLYGIWTYDLAMDFNKTHEEALFINMHHYSPAGNRLISDVLFGLVQCCLTRSDTKAASEIYEKSLRAINSYVKNQKARYGILRRTRGFWLGGWIGLLSKKGFFLLKLYLNAVFKEILANRRREKENCIIGAIVMNANPFTLGHRYLVEYASARVDFLYIFVLGEEKSEFSFYDRLKMVYLGTRDLKNVSVLSGGRNIISMDTFPEYFLKKELQDAKIDAFKDVESFALNVAPYFKINMRFIGMEPIDNVTRQYNEQLKTHLPRYGIAVEEIPRKSDDIGVISASRVRTALEQKDWDSIRKIVPISTLNYLQTYA